MDKERAAQSINVERFIALVTEAVTKAGGDVEAKVSKAREGLTKAVDFYAQARHVELGEYWPTYISALVEAGCPAPAHAASPTSPSPVAEKQSEDTREGADEEILPEDAEAGSPPANEEGKADEEASKEAAEEFVAAPAKPARVITQQEIDERAKFNAGRKSYLCPDDSWAAIEATITCPIPYLQHSILYRESVQKHKEVAEILAECEVTDANTNTKSEKDAGKWTATTKIDSKGYGTYYRAIEGTPFHSLKVVGEVDCNILSSLAVLCELDMYKQWFPMCWQSEEQGRIGDLHRWSTFTVTCMWPVASRSIFIGGFGCDCVNQRKIVIVAKSVNTDTDYLPVECKIPTPQKGTVAAALNCGGFVLEPLLGGKTKISFTMNVDPKLKSVPTAMINWFSGKMIWVLLKNLGSAAKKAEKPGSPYFVRREEQKELYDYFQRRALEVLTPDYL